MVRAERRGDKVGDQGRIGGSASGIRARSFRADCPTQASGRFETARRERTGAVEGRIAPDFHLIMVTLNGSALRHASRTDDGFRHGGHDATGMTCFLPAGCHRQLSLRDGAWDWGAIAMDPAAASPKLS
ncbi:hypothetical protein [Oryzifoliimicrobium ureilyticus]|uniref:hypothetical protein n=1 Tax=Oryzifoliimicrobium ureilyticus TaxID=3113724 RepID=UPI003075F836